jgi:hypothetical protein
MMRSSLGWSAATWVNLSSLILQVSGSVLSLFWNVFQETSGVAAAIAGQRRIYTAEVSATA